jgi:hypothetical protein
MDIPLGVVIERKQCSGRWQAVTWRPIAVVPGGPPCAEWRLLASDGPVTRYYAGRLYLRLHACDTAAYRESLSREPPRLFVVLRRFGEGEQPGDVRPIIVTAARSEAESRLDGGGDIAEPVPMPEVVAVLVQQFVDEHHVDRPFIKRQRRRDGAKTAR